MMYASRSRRPARTAFKLVWAGCGEGQAAFFVSGGSSLTCRCGSMEEELNVPAFVMRATLMAGADARRIDQHAHLERNGVCLSRLVE